MSHHRPAELRSWTGATTSASGQGANATHTLADSVELVIGFDTHKHTHTAAVVTAVTGAMVAQATVTAAPAGYRQLLELADQHHGQRRVWRSRAPAGTAPG